MRELAALTARLAKAENTIITLRAAAGGGIEGDLPTRSAPETGTRLEHMVRERTRELTILTGELQAEIRERMRTEERLLAEKAYREAVENCLVVGIVAVDPKGRHFHVNDAFCSMMGFRREDLLGAGIPYPYWQPEERKAYAAAMRKVLRGEIAPGGREFRFLTRDGRNLDVLLHASPLTVRGKVVGSLASVNDITDRKRMESALRKSEANYRAVVEGQTEFICRFRSDGTLTFVNEAYCRYSGKRREELIGTGFLLALPAEDRGLAWERIASLDSRSPSVTSEHRVAMNAGEVRWQQWTVRAVSDPEGNFVEFQAIGFDVSEHRLADQALMESKAKFQNLVETVSDLVWEVDRNGIYTYVSPKVKDTLGYAPEEVLGKTPFDLMPAFETRRVAEIFRPIFERGEPFQGLENINLHKDGRYVVIETSGAPVFDAEGGFQGYCGVDRDISERKRAEEKLRSSEVRFRQLFEQNEEPLFLFRGGSPEILDVNPAAVQLYGYPREELVRNGLSLFVRPEELSEFSAAITGIGSAGMGIERATHLRRDGTRVIVSIRANSVRTEGEEVVYASFRDITARIRLEEEARLQQARLIHANRMASLGTIVSGVAHEVNNPNNLVMFNAPMILSAWEDAVPVLDAYRRENGDFPLGGLPYSEMREVVPKLAAGISDASARIKAIVWNLKDFARQDIPRQQAPVRVNDVVRMAISILNHEILRATHRFEVAYGEDLPPVMGSSQQLEQVVINLLTNALQALPSSARGIRVSTRRVPGTREVEVRVEDEGVGMSPEVLERIKEPFFSTRLDSGGLGLGVSICRSIVQEHQGTLDFESEEGKGTRAVVRLPGIGDAIGNDAEALASKIPSGV